MLLRRKLFPHQVEALAYCGRLRHPFLAMEMRLGKTLVVIRYLAPFRTPIWRALVVAPKTVLLSWEAELRREGYRFHYLLGPLVNRMASIQPGWNLINYEGVRFLPEIGFRHWDATILDESTACRNPQATTVKALLSGFRDVDKRFCLSGFPAPEGPLDWYCQIAFLYNQLLDCRSYYQFRARYFRPVRYDWAPKPGSLSILKARLNQIVFFKTRKQAGMANVKIRERRYATLGPDFRRAYDSMERDFNFQLAEPDGGSLSTKWATVQNVQLERMAGGTLRDNAGRLSVCSHKVDELVYLFKNDLKGQQVVVWFHFNDEIDLAQSTLAKACKGLSVDRMTGDNNMFERRRSLRDFHSGKTRIFLLQQKLGRFGLDLSCASTMIFYSCSYSGEDRIHAEDRMEHPAKKESNLIIDLLAEDTIDEDKLAVLQDKKLQGSLFFNRLTEIFRSRRCKRQ